MTQYDISVESVNTLLHQCIEAAAGFRSLGGPNNCRAECYKGDWVLKWESIDVSGHVKELSQKIGSSEFVNDNLSRFVADKWMMVIGNYANDISIYNAICDFTSLWEKDKDFRNKWTTFVQEQLDSQRKLL